MKSWVKEITSTCEKDIVYVIAGNKIDLNPSADIQEAEQFARSIQGEYLTTSAKTGSNLDLLFITVAKGEVQSFFFTSSFIEETSSSKSGQYVFSQFCPDQCWGCGRSSKYFIHQEVLLLIYLCVFLL